MFAALAAWLLCTILVVYLVLRTRKWRVAFEQKEWTISPSDKLTELSEALGRLSGDTRSSSKEMAAVINQLILAVTEASDAARKGQLETRDTRSEFAILRDELSSREKQLRLQEAGLEFYYRRKVLKRVLHAFDIIISDASSSVQSSDTLRGVQIELQECLEDNGIQQVAPTIGQPANTVKGIDPSSVRKVPTPDEALRGTVASIESPAYVAIGPNGREEVLQAPRISVYS